MLEQKDFKDIKPTTIFEFLDRVYNRGLLGDVLNNENCLSPMGCTQILTNTMKGRIYGSCLVDSQGKVQGIFIGTLGYQWFAPEALCMNEMMLFITPEYRRGTHFLKLQRYMESECKRLCVPMIQVGNAMKVNVDRFNRVLNRAGYKQRVSYIKTLI